MSKYLDSIRNRNRKAIQENSELGAMKSTGELDTKDEKGVGLPNSGAEGKVEASLSSTGPLDTKAPKGISRPADAKESTEVSGNDLEEGKGFVLFHRPSSQGWAKGSKKFVGDYHKKLEKKWTKNKAVGPNKAKKFSGEFDVRKESADIEMHPLAEEEISAPGLPIIKGNANPAPSIEGIVTADPEDHPAVTEGDGKERCVECAQLAEECRCDEDFDLSEEEDKDDKKENPFAKKDDDDDKDDDDKKDGDDKDSDKKDDKKKDDDKDDVKEHVEALLSGSDLSEEYKAKVETIFEAAVNAVVAKKSDRLIEQARRKLFHYKRNLHEKLAAQLDSYLEYVVEEWMEQNKVGVEHLVRTEITESFIADLRSLFEKHHIDIPTEKYSLVDEMQSCIESLEGELNEEMEKGLQLQQTIKEMKKEKALQKLAEGLSLNQTEKLKTLAEGINFEGDEDFAKKMKTIKESYFEKPKKAAAKLDTLVEDQSGNAIGIDDPKIEGRKDESAERMSVYVSAAKSTSFSSR